MGAEVHDHTLQRFEHGCKRDWNLDDKALALALDHHGFVLTFWAQLLLHHGDRSW
jgi:hypothetical protein